MHSGMGRQPESVDYSDVDDRSPRTVSIKCVQSATLFGWVLCASHVETTERRKRAIFTVG